MPVVVVPLRELPLTKDLREAAPLVGSGACESCGDFNNSLEGIEEEAKHQYKGMKKQDHVADPTFGCFRHAERWYEGDHEE